MSEARGDGPAVTVVIPAYKAERTIARAVESVLGQPGCRPTVIVVVDGSVDGTEALLGARFGGQVRVIVNPENRGVQFSRNAGLAAARDEWVMFLDADDFVEPPLLRGLTDAMVKADAQIGFGPMQVLHERSGKRGPVTHLSGTEEEIFSSWLSGGRFAGTCSVLWRTDFLRGIGGWDTALNRGEDGEAVLRGLLLGARTARSDAGCGVYVMHHSPERLTRRSDNLESLLKVPAKLLALPSPHFPRESVKAACAASYYNGARTCYTRGAAELGDQALREARALGFTGQQGSTLQRLLATALGLPLGCRLERAVRKLAGKAV